MKWFITNPGGFKFNINFNSFLSSLSLFFLHFWRGLPHPSHPQSSS